MAFIDINDFKKKIDKEGELITITQFVDPVLEITEITDRMSKSGDGGKALLFTNNGTDFPLLINMFGSYKRMCLSLGVKNLDEVGEGIDDLFKVLTSPKKTFLDKLKAIPLLTKVSSWMPRSISGRGACQDIIISNPDLSILPILKCWPADGGRFITLPMVITKDPVNGIRNVGMYRMQVLDNQTTGMHWHKHKTGARHYQEYKKLGKRMPVSVALGGDPALTFAATAPLPDNVDEFLFAGFLRKKRVELVTCITNDLEVPACADIIIEGYVEPTEDLIWEGPFGDHTGFYSLADWYPKFHVTCISHRKNAVYPTTIVGIPPMEDAWIAKATERIFLPLIKMSMVPEILDMNMPFVGVAHNLVLTNIEKTYPGQGLKVMNALWGAGQMMFNKILVVLDTDNALDDYLEVAKTVSENINPGSDIYFSKGPLDVLDHSASKMSFGGKMFIDGTTKLKEEQNEPIKSNPLFFDYKKIKELFPEILFCNDSLTKIGISFVILSIQKDKAKQVSTLSTSILNSGFCNVKAILFVDSNVEIQDLSTTIWIALNNIDAERDNHIDKEHNCLIIDGTRKQISIDSFERDWPNVVTSSPDTILAIDNKWKALGLGKMMYSPSSKFRKLVVSNGAIAESLEGNLS
jgi:4-hydroxy-3-polyprenylbenzoate decarboxylase